MQTVSIGVQAIPLIAIAAVALHAAFYHLNVTIQRRGVGADFVFALCCFAVALYAGFFALQLSLTHPEAIVRTAYVQLVATAAFAPCLLWFVHVYTEYRASAYAKMLGSCYVLLLVMCIFGPREWTVMNSVQQGLILNVPWGEPSPFLEAKQGPLGDVQVVLHALSVPYAVWICLRYLFAHRNARAAVLAVALGTVCVAAINDIAVFEGWVMSMYYTLYAFILLVVFMGQMLVTEVAAAARVKDVLRLKDEQVQMAIDAGRLVFWDWRVRDDEIHASIQQGGEARPGSNGARSFAFWRSHIAPQDQPDLDMAISPCFDGASDEFSVDVRAQLQEAGYRWYLVRGKVFERDRANGRPLRISGTAADIDDTKRLQQAHAESERRAAAILDGVSSFLFIFVHDVEGTIRIASGDPVHSATRGREVAGELHVSDVEPAVTHATLENRMVRAIRDGEVSYQARFRQGSYLVPVEARARPLQWMGETLLLVVARDISERRMTEQRLNEVLEAERQMLGQDLHDGIGQYLTAISFRSSMLLKRAKDRRWPCVDDVGQIAELAARVAQETRFVARSLYGLHMIEAGLRSAVEDLAQFYRQHFDAACEVEWVGEADPLEKERALHVYRLLQEALNNAFKHSESRHVHVRVVFEGDTAIAEVTNEGKVWVESTEGGSGMGVQNMRRRALLLGGTLDIRARPEGGCRVMVTFPRVSGGGV